VFFASLFIAFYMQEVSKSRTEKKASSIQQQPATTKTIITSCESRAIKNGQEQQEAATKNVFFFRALVLIKRKDNTQTHRS